MPKVEGKLPSCASCGEALDVRYAHHFNADGAVWHLECPPPDAEE